MSAPGNRILGFKVVAASGAPLSVGASTVRATIFCVPYFLNNAFIDAGVMTSWWLAAVALRLKGFAVEISGAGGL